MVEKALKSTQEEYKRIKAIPEEQRNIREKDTVHVYDGMKQKKEDWEQQLEAEKARSNKNYKLEHSSHLSSLFL